MSEIEDELGMILISERRWIRDEDDRYACETPRKTLWRILPSYVIWQAGLGVFLLVNLAIMIEILSG